MSPAVPSATGRHSQLSATFGHCFSQGDSHHREDTPGGCREGGEFPVPTWGGGLAFVSNLRPLEAVLSSEPPQTQLESLGGLHSPCTQWSLLPPHPVPSWCSSQEHPRRNFLRVKSLSYNVLPRKHRSQIGSRTFCTFSSVQSPPAQLVTPAQAGRLD